MINGSCWVARKGWRIYGSSSALSIFPCTLGGSFDQAAESHHCPRCERHGAGEAARGNPHKHQKTVPPGQSSFTFDWDVCAQIQWCWFSSLFLSRQVVTRLIHLLGQKILGNLQQARGPFSGKGAEVRPCNLPSDLVNTESDPIFQDPPSVCRAWRPTPMSSTLPATSPPWLFCPCVTRCRSMRSTWSSATPSVQ